MDHGREQGRHTYEVRPKVERVWGETKPWDIKRLYNFLGFNFRFEWMLSIRLPLVEVFQYNYSVLRQYFNCRIRTGRENSKIQQAKIYCYAFPQNVNGFIIAVSHLLSESTWIGDQANCASINRGARHTRKRIKAVAVTNCTFPLCGRTFSLVLNVWLSSTRGCWSDIDCSICWRRILSGGGSPLNATHANSKTALVHSRDGPPDNLIQVRSMWCTYSIICFLQVLLMMSDYNKWDPMISRGR